MPRRFQLANSGQYERRERSTEKERKQKVTKQLSFDDQESILLAYFEKSQILTDETRELIGKETGLTDESVEYWFNRRMAKTSEEMKIDQDLISEMMSTTPPLPQPGYEDQSTLDSGLLQYKSK